MSHFDLRRFKAIPDLTSRILFGASAVFDYFFSCFDFNHLSTCYPSPVLKAEEKARWEWQVLTRREVDDGVRATLRFLAKS